MGIYNMLFLVLEREVGFFYYFLEVLECLGLGEVNCLFDWM